MVRKFLKGPSFRDFHRASDRISLRLTKMGRAMTIKVAMADAIGCWVLEKLGRFSFNMPRVVENGFSWV